VAFVVLACAPAAGKKLRLPHLPKPDVPESHHAEPEHSHVVALLNTSSLDGLYSAHPFVAVLFYAPWYGACGYCDTYAPARHTCRRIEH
jgi:hypothetical protein